jgi:hypothetical protein
MAVLHSSNCSTAKALWLFPFLFIYKVDIIFNFIGLIVMVFINASNCAMRIAPEISPSPTRTLFDWTTLQRTIFKRPLLPVRHRFVGGAAAGRGRGLPIVAENLEGRCKYRINRLRASIYDNELLNIGISKFINTNV